MASTSDIKKGLCLEMNGDIWFVKEFQHVKPGKGNAFVRMKLKSLTTGKVVENTVVAGHDIADVRVERRNYQYLYNDGATYFFMNNDTFEQAEIPESMIESPEFLREGETVQVVIHSEKETPLACELPLHVVLQITYVEPGAKGDTATNTLTPATVETGATVRVPLFIKEGDYVKIDTSTGDYIERTKKPDVKE